MLLRRSLARPRRHAAAAQLLLLGAIGASLLYPIAGDSAVARVFAPGAKASLAEAAPAAGLRRSPYLTDVTSTRATVNFATDAQSPAPVMLWGLASGNCAVPPNSVSATFVTSFTVSAVTSYQFKTPISGLTANTAYCYRVLQNGVDLPGTSIVFRTAPTPGVATPFSFAVIGDWGAGTTDEANIFTQIAADAPTLLVTVGDNAYQTGNQADYGDLTNGNVFPAAYLPKLGGGTPIFAAQGNHGFTSHSAYLQNFPQADTVAASGGAYSSESYCCAAGTSGTTTYASAWYAFTWGNARFYILEAAWADPNGKYQGDFTSHWNGPVTGCVPCGQEKTWLTNDLAANASVPLKFAFFHYPLYADNNGQPGDSYLQGPSALEGLLAAHNVGLAFNGHAHLYERNRPMISGRPLVSYVTGGGGDDVANVDRCSAFDAYAVGHASSCNAPVPSSDAQVFHYLLVTVNGNNVTVTPTDETGATFDVQNYTFAPGSPATVPDPPTSVTAAAGAGSATVSWTPPADNGGIAITGYNVTSTPGNHTASTTGATTVTLPGLTNGTSYRFSVTATNVIGTSAPSALSNAVIPFGGATYVPLTPARLLDTRVGNGLSGPFTANTPRTFQVSGRGGVPANATGVTGNFTVTNQTAAGAAFLGPNSTASPATSTLNFPLADTRANGVTLALGAGGTLSATYLYTAGATTDFIFDVTGYFVPNTTGATYVPLTPARLLDTRVGNGLSGPFTANTPRTFQVSGRGGVPANATGVTGNFTVTNQTAAGAAFLGPNSTATPATSTLNFPLGDTRANGVTLALGAGGTLSATYIAASGSTDFIFDVTGYFVPNTTGATYVALTPARLLDTRVGNGLSGKFTANTPRTFQVTGRGGVPANATGVTGNFTVTNQTAAGAAFLGPNSTASPATSTLNFPLADTRANGVTLALGAGGTLSATYLYTPGATTDFIFDVTGYFSP